MQFSTRLKKAIKEAGSIAIFTHRDNDHDTICSAVTLKLFLRKMGKTSTIFVDKLPSKAIVAIIGEQEFATSGDQVFDLGIVVDCAEKKRLPEKSIDIFQKCKQTFNIDHHVSNLRYADYNFVRPMSSACEVIFWLFRSEKLLDATTARLLYAGIYMDSGALKYSSANSKTHRCAAELMKHCPTVNDDFFVCFGVAGRENFEITKRAINSIRFFKMGQIAVSILKKEDFLAAKCPREEGKFIVTYMQSIAGVKISINISEDTENLWRISLRTPREGIDVSRIAQRFHGGGHVRAAGLTLKGELEKALRALVAECNKELNR